MGTRLHQSAIILHKEMVISKQKESPFAKRRRQGTCGRTEGQARGLTSARRSSLTGRSSWRHICPMFPGDDWEPWKNSKQRVRLQKTSPDTKGSRPVWGVLLQKWGSKLWPRPGPVQKTLSRQIPEGVAMDQTWEMKQKKERGNFQASGKIAVPP